MRKGLRRIFVVFKTHFDIGFTGLVSEVLEGYANVMVPQALDACRKTMANEQGHRYVWTLPAWPLAYCLNMLSESPIGKELEQRVREGAVAWHALPFTTHSELFGLEDLIRGLYIGRSLGRRFGRTAVAAKMTDVPGHTWILPTLLAAAGVRFLHLGCNPCSTPPEVPRLFFWEGPDSSRVMTMYSRGGYGTGLLPPPDWTLPVWLALQHTNDNAGPQRAEVVQQILDSIQKSAPGTEVIFGTLDDFAQALGELHPDLPVVRKDLADSWIHGAGTMPAEVSKLRDLRDRLLQAESVAAMRVLSRMRDQLGTPGPAALPTSVATAYEKILLFGEHTWGMDTKLALNPKEFGGRVYDKEAFQAVRASGRYERIERSWRDKAGLVAEADTQVQDLEATLIGRRPDKPVRLPAVFEVVNHHLWEWSGLLRLGTFHGAVRVVQESDGQELSVSKLDDEAWVRVQRLPPVSVTHLRVEKAHQGAHAESRASPFKAAVRASPSTLALSNGLIRIKVDRGGAGVVGLTHIETGREWVDRRAGVPFGAYQYDVYSRQEIVDYLKSYAYDLEPWFLDDFGKPGYPPDVPHRVFEGKLARVTKEEGRGWARLLLAWSQDPESVRRFGNSANVLQAMTIFDEAPWVDLEYSVRDKEACPVLEAGHVVLPFLSRDPRYAINKTGTVIDPATDIEKNANHALYCCERWLDISDSHGGMLVIPRDTPLFSLGSKAIERFSGSATLGRPTVHFNLFNTQWGTNFPQWISGSFRFRFRLVPHSGTWQRARAWELAAAALQPPACLPSGPASRPGLGMGLLESSVTGLETVALKVAEDGNGVVLRLREPSGRAGRRILRFRSSALSPETRLVACSLLEEEQKVIPLTRTRDSVSALISVRPFEVITLKLTP